MGSKTFREWLGKYIITIDVDYGGFNEGNSEFTGNLKVIPKIKSDKSLEIPVNKLKMNELSDCNGQLHKVKLYYELSKEELNKLEKIVFTSRFDLNGDGKTLIPTKHDKVCTLKQLYDPYSLGNYWYSSGPDSKIGGVEFSILNDYEYANAYFLK